MACEGCTDPNREFNLMIDSYRRQAKKEANETKQAIAVCKEGYEVFTMPARDAIAENRHIIEVISGL